jgi:hypothetical protein
MSKLNLDDVLFICLGMADAAESRRETSDTESWRDATDLMDTDASAGKGPTCVAREAAEDEERRLLLDSSFGGTCGAGCSGDLPSKESAGPACAPCFPSPVTSTPLLEGSAESAGSGTPERGTAVLCPSFDELPTVGAASGFAVVATSLPAIAFFGRGALKSCTLVPLIRGS